MAAAAQPNADVPVLYYAFDLLYLDGYDLRRVPLEERKKKLASVVIPGDSLRYSDHYERAGQGAVRDRARRKDLKAFWQRSVTAFIRSAAAASG